MATAGRADEFRLLWVIGARRSQVLRTTVIEALVVAGGAVVLGALAVTPAILGVTYGFAHTDWPTLNWPLVLGLVSSTAVIAAVGIPAVAALKTRKERA